MDELAAAREALARGDYPDALSWADKAEIGAEGRGLAEAWLIRATVHRAQGGQEVAETLAGRASDAAEKAGWEDLRLRASLLVADLEAGRGDASDAARRYAALLPGLTGTADELRCRLGLAHAVRALGRTAEAHAEFLAALALAQAIGDRKVEAVALSNLASGLISTGELDAAADAFRRAENLCRAVGDRRVLAEAVMGSGEVLRIRGDFLSAEARYREALAIQLEIGSGQWLVTRMNLGLSLSERGCHEEAEGHLRAVLQAVREQGRTTYEVVLRLMLLPCSAGRRRWDQWDKDYDAAGEFLLGTPLADADVARTAERSAELCAGSGELGRAARSLELALLQWRALHRPVDVQRVTHGLLALRLRGAPIPVGPFDLRHEVGTGGMGVVWRAVHRGQNLAVAVKVLTREAAREETRRELLRAEVRSMAGLDHPNIVPVLDQGEIGPAAEAMAAGGLAEGSPWVAMELAERSLESACGVAAWPTCRAALREVLHGLAHAHARGVVHLDVKPANVLIVGDRVVLGDFGVSRALAGEDGETIAGTPGFMAPEQFLGRFRDFGPWTDVYAVGCLAVALVTGLPPFLSGRFEALREAHLTKSAAVWPRIGVPSGFEAWALRCLEKHPARRFRLAADALYALDQLGDAGPAPAWLAPEALLDEEVSCTFAFTSQIASRDLPNVATPTAVPELVADPESPGAPVSSPGVEPVPDVRPPFPLDWRSPKRPRRPAALIGAAMGLYGVRAVPFIGRIEERDSLWAALAATIESGGPRAVLIHGASGFGRSRLARWLGVRANELGAATWLRVAAGAETVAGVRRAIRRGAAGETNAAVDERHELAAAALREATRSRPVVLVLDDVHEDADALAWVRFLLDDPSVGPALVLCVARDEVLADRPMSGSAWRALGAHPATMDLPIGPLNPRDRREFVAELLGFDETLAAQVDARTGGNPLFAVQLVGDWVQRGLLVHGARGFALRAGVAPTFPDGLHEVWSERVARLTSGLPPGAREALEIAAILGISVDAAEWRGACAAAGVAAPPELWSRLIASRLASVEPAGWAFEHQALREAVERLATEAGRVKSAYRACAGVVTDPARRGRSLLGAGDAEAALAPLLAAARARLLSGDDAGVLALVDVIDEALRGAAALDSDVRRGEALILRCNALGELGRLEDSEEVANRLVSAAYRHAWDPLLPEALRLLAKALRAGARWDRSEALFRESVELFEEGGDRAGAARSRHGLGLLLRRQGRLDEAAEALERAMGDFAAVGDTARLLWCRYGLGSVYQEAGDGERAAELFEDLRLQYIKRSDPLGVSDAWVGLAEVARQRGDLDAAERGCEEALRLLEGFTAMRSLPPLINLALISLARGEFDEARRRLDDLRRLPGGLGLATYRAICSAALLAVDAAADEATYDRVWTEAQTEVRRAREVNRDVAWCLGVAADRASAAGFANRATRARGLVGART